MRKRTVLRMILTFVSLVMIGFIFVHSLMPAEESAEESGSLVEVINTFLKRIGASFTVTDHLVRKTAHFSEFFLLGVLLFFTVRAYTKKLPLLLTVPLVTGALTACTDEWIQTFTPGRSGEWGDVLLDCTGLVTAVLLLFVIRLIIVKKRERKIE